MSDHQGRNSQTTGDPVILEAARQAWNSGYRAAVGELRSLAEDTTNNELAIVILRLADTLEHLNVE